MHITLNIGLDVSKNYLPEGVAEMKLKFQYVEEYLNKALGKPACIGLARSDTEETVVAQYARAESVLYKLYRLADELQQDCIAYAIQDDGVTVGGALVGKGAHEWNHGLWNEAYFIPATLKLNYRTGLPL